MLLIGDLLVMLLEGVVGLADAAGEILFRRTWRWKVRLLVAALFLLPLVLVLSFALV